MNKVTVLIIRVSQKMEKHAIKVIPKYSLTLEKHDKGVE